MTLLDISESTFYRWKLIGTMPRAHYLVLRSVARGLPVLASMSRVWDGHYFGVDGALYTPTGYPMYPADLWLFEFANRNGCLEPAKRLAKHAANDWQHVAANDDGPMLA
ncbi:hypothetical protein [Salinisphaera hydrothermalis]|uniref:hypothetical protein n=1 Tax=Salinisphaera hydrothermalis TaxID=563188 RepID=UPI00333E5C07